MSTSSREGGDEGPSRLRFTTRLLAPKVIVSKEGNYDLRQARSASGAWRVAPHLRADFLESPTYGRGARRCPRVAASRAPRRTPSPPVVALDFEDTIAVASVRPRTASSSCGTSIPTERAVGIPRARSRTVKYSL